MTPESGAGAGPAAAPSAGVCVASKASTGVDAGSDGAAAAEVPATVQCRRTGGEWPAAELKART